MQQWEYLILDCNKTSDNIWRPWRTNGVEIPNWQSLRVMETINKLGMDGWEMVGFSHSSSEGEYWVFKRPK